MCDLIRLQRQLVQIDGQCYPKKLKIVYPMICWQPAEVGTLDWAVVQRADSSANLRCSVFFFFKLMNMSIRSLSYVTIIKTRIQSGD